MSICTTNGTDLSSKVAIITGSCSDIGVAVAVLLAKNGAQVVVIDSDESKLLKVAQRCDESALHGNKWHFMNNKWQRVQKALPIVADIAKDEDCKKLIDIVIENLGKIDLLINNASSKEMSRLINAKLINIYDRVMSLDLRSVIYLTHLAIPYLESSNGVIINVSSTAAIIPVYY
jgi:NAD(P)-dependent dehydrogenase (short-subunit alcohol dehydrogenase family)